jgi:hypothetical protein
MTLLSWGINSYIVDLCIIRCYAFYKCNMETMGFHVFCNIIDSIVFVNIFMLKYLIIMVGQFVRIFVTMFSKMEMKKFPFIYDGL